ncbi:MAG: methyltransferase domain-containing protein [Candidatus Pacearchaeota archaeon]
MIEKTEPPDHIKESKIRTVGPVINLEEHVKPDWWKKIFNSVYLKTDGDVVDDKSITKKEIDAFSNVLGLSKEHRILDLCCGQGRHSLEFSRRGFNFVEGLDRSRYLIRKAKESAKKEGLSIKFREGDARKLPYSADSFDVVMIPGNSFGYFETVNDDLRVLKEVFRILKPNGKLLIDIADGEYLHKNFQSRSWEWIDKKYFVCRERSIAKDMQRIISREIVSHVDKGVIVDQFYSERLYTKDSVKKILNEAGFSKINFPMFLNPDSKRNQDLGMMEQRIIVTCAVEKDWTEVKKRNREIKNIFVIQGDPNKTDEIKPSCVFDDDDFYTINQLKNSLREIESKGYKFTYVYNHDNLISDLAKSKDKITYVLNLCDEGFANDARKELHVPAVLEMLDISYTGAGPQCLAYCYDKSLTRGIAEEMRIPVSQAIFIKPEDIEFDLPFNFPVIVKPNFGDSSFGITQKCVASNHEELLTAISEIRDKFGYDKPILVEEFLTGKDISVGIIGNPPQSYSVLPITEEDYSAVPENLPKICGYEAKWLPDSPYWNIKSIPAELPEDVKVFIIDSCLKLFERLECRDYARFDWRFDSNGNPKLLEVNPNPGWCWDGHLAKMSKYAGLTYTDMLKAILSSAERRFNSSANGNGKKEEPIKIVSLENKNKEFLEEN